MTKKYFGTDGIRGEVGQFPITPEFMLKLGWAAGKAFAAEAPEGKWPKILIGKDTRLSGYMFEAALQAGLIAAGVNVGLLGPMPTPAIAYLTRTFRAQAGIVISASHNPYMDNGIKFFGPGGAKLPDELEHQIERLLDEEMDCIQQLGKAYRIDDAPGRYIEYCKSTTPMGFSLKGMKIVVDCANGATYHVAPSVLKELGASVVKTAVQPNGENINRDCGSTHTAGLQAAVLEHRADLGIAFDGDGDRVIMVDAKGEEVDGDELLFIMAAYRHQFGPGCSGVVGTLMTNYGCELAFKELGIPFERAKVGDRYVKEAMQKNEWLLGGESSGHLICGDLTTTGDGIVAALQVLLAVQVSDKPLHELKRAMNKLPQTMINVRVKDKAGISGNQTVQAAVGATEEKLAGRGRVLLRPSGTEPVVRVMVEGEDKALVARLAMELAEVVKEAA